MKLLKGGAWMSLQRISIFIFGFVKLTILTRYISPTEFGIFGIALITLDVISYFATSGFRQAIIQKKGDVSDYLNSVWTFRIMRSMLSAVLLFLLAPLAAYFFKSPESAPVIRAISVIFVIRAFVNIADVYLQKNLDFKTNFFYITGGNVIDLVLSVVFAVILKNFWALFIGYTTSAVYKCIISYVLFKYRPKFELDFQKIRELFVFSRWMFASSTIIVLIMYLDNIFVGKLIGITALGLYQVAFKFSRSGTGEVNNILGQIYFPYFSAIQENKRESTKVYRNLLKINTILALFIATGTFCLSPAFTKLFMDEKWISIIPVIRILAFASVIDSIVSSAYPFFKGMGHPKFVLFIQLVSIVSMVGFISLLANKGVNGIALGVVLAGFASFLSWLIFVPKLIPGFFNQFLKIVLPPLVAAVFMALTMSLFWYLPGISDRSLNIFQFFMSGIAGSAVFAFLLFIYTKLVPDYGEDFSMKEILELLTQRNLRGRMLFNSTNN